MSVVFLVLISVLSALIALYIISKWKYDYWRKKKVPHLKPTPLLGNYGPYITVKKYYGHVVQDICRQFPNEPYVGAYFGTEPTLILQDPELIKLITTKDFHYFHGREISKYTDRETLTRNMFFTQGDRWKLIRQNITPLFTASKIKGMFPLVQKCARTFEKLLERETRISNVVEVRSLVSRYMMDCVGSCGFGVEFNTMDENVKDNYFSKIADLIFEISKARGLALSIRSVWPAIFYGLGFQVFPSTISKFFHKLLVEVFEQRNYKPSSRNDFVDMLLSLKQQEYLTCESMTSNKKEKVTMKIDDEWLVAQCVVFFAAGFDPTSIASSFTLYELAKNQEAQQRAYEEVKEYLSKKGGKIEYDCVTELPYLEACADEALRLYPPLSVLTREVMADYTLPTGLRLEKGVRIHLPIYHLHHNPDHFPEPEKYKPERFLPENKANIKPNTYMPFGEGHRICIGMRVGKMQLLPGLVTVLRHYRLELADDMSRELQMEPSAFSTQNVGGILLKLIPRDQERSSV